MVDEKEETKEQKKGIFARMFGKNLPSESVKKSEEEKEGTSTDKTEDQNEQKEKGQPKDFDEMSPEQKKIDEEEEKKIKDLVQIVTNSNKKMDEVYDETVRRVDMKKKLIPLDEKLEEEHKTKVQALIDKYGELKAKISNCRKEGKDPIIAELMSRSIQSKIKMAQVTREIKDFQAVEQDIENCLKEVEEAEKEEIINVKKEIEKRYKEIVQKETGKVQAEDE